MCGPIGTQLAPKMLSWGSKQSFALREVRWSSSKNTRTLGAVLDQIEHFYGNNKTISDKIQSLRPIIPSQEGEFERKTITLGVVHGKGVSGGLLTNALISDPFSSTPPTPLVNEFRRSHMGKNIKIVPANFAVNDANEYLGGGVFKLKSPFLSADNRVLYDAKQGDGTSRYLETLRERGLLNDIAIVEVNDQGFSPIEDVKGVEEISISEPSNEVIGPNDAQVWVYVTNEATDVNLLNDYPYTVVINDTATLNTLGNVVDQTKPTDSKVDLAKVEEADTLIGEDVKNVSAFIRLHRESNIHELLYGLTQTTAGYTVLVHLLRSLVRDVVSIEQGEGKTTQRLVDMDDSQIRTKLEAQVKHWSQDAHYELQSTVEPYLGQVLEHKYAGILQLVIHAGDLSVVLSNILLEARDDIKVRQGLFGRIIEGHGSLKDQWSNGKYLEGKMDALAPCGDVSKEEAKMGAVESVERSVNKKLTEKILPELQGKLNDLLVQNLTIPPLVTGLVTSIGFIEDMITLNTGCALTVFAIALGAFRAQGGISRVMAHAKLQWMEELRRAVEDANRRLWNKVATNVAEKGQQDSQRQETLAELRRHLAELESKQQAQQAQLKR